MQTVAVGILVETSRLKRMTQRDFYEETDRQTNIKQQPRTVAHGFMHADVESLGVGEHKERNT